MKIFGIAISLAVCSVIGFFVFIFVDSLHHVEGASWIALVIGLVVATLLGWAVIKVWENLP